MKLSDETYDVIEENYGLDVASYARSMVEGDPTDFHGMESTYDAGLEVAMDQYLDTLGEEGLDTALEEFAQDLQMTEKLGVLRLLQAESNNQTL